MIEIKGVRKSYGRHEVLRGVELSVARGRITCIAGPNACGKTTLIKSILGLVTPQAGRILIDGRDATRDPDARRLVGYMPQYPDYPQNLRVREIFSMIEDLRGAPAELRLPLLRHFGIENTLEQPFGELSGGTKQKVAACIAFLFDAPCLVLDEPTAGLDPVSTLHFKDWLRVQATRGKTILMVSHVMTEVAQLAHDLVFMLDGRISYAGGIDQLRELTGESDLERAVARKAAGA